MKHSGWVGARQTVLLKARIAVLAFFYSKGQAGFAAHLPHN
jgi:hypothetical protein